MKYFFLASKFSLFNQYNTRKLSYKVRKDLVYMLSKMENNPKTNYKKPSIISGGQQTQCPCFTVQVLANGASESSGLIMHTGIESYFFNCGEGVQRCASSYGVKLLKAYNMFVTSPTWANIGGTMGLALTLQASGVKKLNIYGPPLLKKVICGWESFTLLKTLSVKVISNDPKLLYDDGCLKIQFVPLYKNFPTPAHQSNSDHLAVTDFEQSVNFAKNNRSHSEARTSEDESDTYVQCYICKTPRFGQHIDVNACLEKGLEIGPILKILQNNKSVTLSDGKVVHLDEVCSSDGEYKIIIVIECPSTKYLDSLLNEEAFTTYQDSSSEPADLIIHLTPQEVMNEPLYQEWMSKFRKVTKHVIINSENSRGDLVSVHHVQTKLNYINPEIFPLLDDHGLPLLKEELSGTMTKTFVEVFSCKNEKIGKGVAGKLEEGGIEYPSESILQSCPEILHNFNGMSVIRPLPTLSLQYYPKPNFDYKHNLVFDPFGCIKTVKNYDNITDDLNELADFNRQWKASDEYKKLSDYPKVLFLGTGSSMPSKYRSTSAILIYLNEDNLILLDCGEGTYRQIERHFGKENMPEFMEKLKMIYVSHHHADHHMGMVNILIVRQKLLAARKKDTSEKYSKSDDILLLVPPSISDWLLFTGKLYDSMLYKTKIVTNSTLGRVYDDLVEPLAKIGVAQLRVCRVEHCKNATGISITDNNNFKITYSGDCKPSTSLTQMGKDSNLLIHEATFEDVLAGMARQKCHSTFSQAIEVGKNMNAGFNILTHFSQRYANIPQLPENIPDNVTIAFDNMMVCPKTLPVLPKMLKFYKAVFAEKIEKLNRKTLKRNFRNENNESELYTKIRIKS